MIRLLVVAVALIGANWGQRPIAFAQEKEPAAAVADETAAAAAPVAKNLELERGWEFYRRGEWGKAQAAFERAIAAEPASPLPHVGRAYALNAQHKYDQGTAELWQAIRCNPGDVGLDYDPLANRKKKLSAEALRHGEEQVRKMLKDRPAMAKYVSPGDALWKWAVRKFAGEDVDELVYWEPSDPSPLTSDSGPTDTRIVVRLAASSEGPHAILPRSFDDLWSDAAFELHHIAPSEGDGKTGPIADEGQFDKRFRDAFKEIDAVGQKTRAFYLKCYLPWLRSRGAIATNPAEWQFYTFPPTGDAQAWLAYWKVDPRWELYFIEDELVRAEVDFRNENYEKAKENLQSLSERGDKCRRFESASIHYWLGCIHQKLNEQEQAIKEFAQALDFDPNCDVAHIQRGKIYRESKQFDKAFADFDAAIRIVPDDAVSRLERGHTWYLKEDFDRAIADYTEALRLDAKNTDAYYWRGNAQAKLGKTGEAIVDYVTAMKIDSERAELYVARGDARCQRQEFDLATLDYSAAIQIDANCAEAFYGRGHLRFDQCEYADALADFREAARLDPTMTDAQNFLAWILATFPDEKLRNGAEAVSVASKACENSAWKNEGVIATLACALAEAGRFDEAVQRMEEALTLAEKMADSDQTVLKNWLELFKRKEPYHQKPEPDLDVGWKLYHRRQWERALAAFDKAKASMPDSPLPYAGRACALIAQGNFDEGSEEMWEAIRHNPGDVGPDYDLGAKGALNAKALRHGEEQLRKMLHDRPAMAEHIKPGDELWKWAVRKFGGEDVNAFVYWDPRDSAPYSACCGQHRDSFFIRVRATPLNSHMKQSRGFDELWGCAAFELHNIAIAARKSTEVSSQVMQDQISQEDHNLAILEAESVASQQTRAFYLKLFLPWLQSQSNYFTDPTWWECYRFPPTDDRIARLKFWQADSRWESYSAGYDLECASREYGKNDNQKAHAILESLQEREQHLGFGQLATINYLYGCLHEKDNDPQQAIAEFNKALACDPDYRYAKLERGKMLATIGETAKAVDELTKLIQTKNDWADAYYCRATVFVEAKQYDRAIADLDAAIRLEPETRSYLTRAEVFVQKGDYERADADCSEAIRLDPEDVEAFFKRAWARQQQHRLAEAIADLREVVFLAPDSAVGFNHLAWILATYPDENIRDGDEAVTAATKACELTEWKDYAIVDTLACALAEAGKFDEAAGRMEQAIGLLKRAEPRNGSVEMTHRNFKARLELFKQRKPYHEDLVALVVTEPAKVAPCSSAAAPCNNSACCRRRYCRRGILHRCFRR